MLLVVVAVVVVVAMEEEEIFVGRAGWGTVEVGLMLNPPLGLVWFGLVYEREVWSEVELCYEMEMKVLKRWVGESVNV